MSYSDAALLRQLSSNSTPYRDPLGVIEWGQLNLDDPWLPEPALSLYGLPEYETLSDAIKRRLSHYEFVNVMLCGICALDELNKKHPMTPKIVKVSNVFVILVSCPSVYILEYRMSGFMSVNQCGFG